MNKRKIKVQPNRFEASFIRNTFDEKTKTIDVVFATGAPVKRFSFFDGEFIEQLSMKKSHIRLDRLKKGAPVLNNHSSFDLSDILGVTSNPRLEDGVAVATVKFSNREEIQGFVDDVRDEVIKNISVGYRVHKFKEEKKENEDDVPVLTAIDWEPLEISFVTIPADMDAQARSEVNNNYEEIVVEEQENETMGKRAKNKAAKKVAEASSTTDVVEEKRDDVQVAPVEEDESEVTEEVAEDKKEDEVKEEEEKEETKEDKEEDDKEEERNTLVESVRTEERTRISEIRSLCDTHKLDKKFYDSCINSGNDIKEIRSLILENLEKRSKESKTFNHNLEVNDVDNKNLRNEARVRTLLNKYDPAKYELKDGDREYAGNSIIDMAREYLQTECDVRGVLAMSKTEVAKRALHHSSDFPELLANTSNKSLRAAYEGTPNTYSPFTREVSRSDFKESSSVQIGDGGKLEKVNEHGEYKRSGIGESAEKYKLEKFGKIIGHTWELMVNDDLDAFTRIPARLGVRAREKENELMWGLVTSNALAGQVMLEDGVNMFDAAHGNLGTAGPIAIASLGEAREAMRLQKDLDGELIGGLGPKYLYVPAALETIAQQFVTQTTPNQAGQVNPFTSNTQVIVEPRLDAQSQTGWYMMADKNMIDMAELARLDGRGPEIFTREGFDVDGMEVKIRYVFAVRVIDYRGFFRNNGV